MSKAEKEETQRERDERMAETRKLLDRDFNYLPKRVLLDAALGLEGYAIVCERDHEQEPHIFMETPAGDRWTLEQRLVYHSPTGMEFGYGGSGPADLALNILALVCDPLEADRLHQQFKWGVMGKAFSRDGGRLALDDVMTFVREFWVKEENDPRVREQEDLIRQEREADEGRAHDRKHDVDDGDYIAERVAARDDVPPTPYD
jgi:hypothetical protein